jgi:hypothetical protein
MNNFTTKYESPQELKDSGYEPVHLLKTFNEKGEPVGFVEMKYFGGKPPFYFVQSLANITVNERNEKESGVGNELIEKTNAFLDSKKQIVCLGNTSGLDSFYSDRGWTESTLAKGVFFYGNPTQEEELAILDKLQKHLVKTMDQE